MNQTTAVDQPQQMSRRTFLCSLSITITGAFLAACGPPRGSDQSRIAFGPQATPPVALPSPMPATTPTTTQESETLPLVEFLALSALLTGVADLDPQVGRVYLQSLQASSEFDVTVEELYERAGFRTDAPPTTVAALEAAGIFAQETTRSLADRIIELWYTGVYINEAGEETVATFVDALAWRTLAFTKPMTICGYPGFWSEAWELVLD